MPRTPASLYMIVIHRHHYGPKTIIGLHCDDSGHPVRLGRADALAEIERLEDAPYYLSHAESGRPSYSLTRETSQRASRLVTLI